ncbi:MAG TPA: methyltransferase domain-containing protein [Verrucomicrobiae bacterium]|nr:methyltransferase domain-containing protein [Verrucomicrobiae bacterium]
MNRVVQPELLDVLSPQDPKAIRSREDLRRLNAAMGHARLLADSLQAQLEKPKAVTLVELGAGDGICLLRVAQRLGRRNPAARVDVTLVDLQNLLTAETERDFERLNWHVRAVQSDVFDFLQRDRDRSNLMFANLFLHHFTDLQLKDLLQLISERTDFFLALETRRARFPLIAGWMVGLIGCNSVTRHDAVVSVEGGFAANELGRLWPRGPGWQLDEHSAGLFSHRFVAKRGG